MAVHQSEAVTGAQKNRVPVPIKKAVRSQALSVESMERDDYNNGRGVTIKAGFIFMSDLQNELNQTFDYVKLGLASSEDESVELNIRFD